MSFLVLFQQGLEKNDDEPMIIHEHQYATDSTDGKVMKTDQRTKCDTMAPRSPQKSHIKLTGSHVSEETAQSEHRPAIKVCHCGLIFCYSYYFFYGFSLLGFWHVHDAFHIVICCIYCWGCCCLYTTRSRITTPTTNTATSEENFSVANENATPGNIMKNSSGANRSDCNWLRLLRFDWFRNQSPTKFSM